jgi:hypothetical protein
MKTSCPCGQKPQHDGPSLTCHLLRPQQVELHQGQMVDYPEMRRISNVVDEIGTASTYHSVDRRAGETKTCSYRKHTQKREDCWTVCRFIVDAESCEMMVMLDSSNASALDWGTNC